MAAFPLQWNPEDDLLLKNSLEAGASLESLAKGAVRFSRQFTVQELHDRWYSLLYDPVVSDQGAAHMIGVDKAESTNQSKSNRPGSIKEIAGNSDKRKSESVQRCYYSMRKRICSEPINIMDVDPLYEPGYINSGFGVSNEPHPPNIATGDPSFALDQIGSVNEWADFNLIEDGNLRGYSEYGVSSFPHYGHSSLLDQVPITSNIRDNSACNMLTEFGEEEQPNEDQLILPLSGNVNEFLTPSTEEYLAELFDSPNDEQLMDDIEDEETLGRSYFAGLSSLLLDSPNDNELLNEASDNKGPDYCDSVEVPSLQLDTEAFGPELQLDTEAFGPELQLDTEAFGPELQLDTEAFGPEYRNGVICCTLNTEDLEVPSNDDVFLPYRLNGTPYLVPSPIKNYSSTQKGDENDNRAHSHDKGLSKALNTSLNLKAAEPKVKYMLPNSDTQCVTPGITTPKVKFMLPNSDMQCVTPGITTEGRPSASKSSDNEDSNIPIRKEVLVKGENLGTASSNAESRDNGAVANDVNEAVPSDQPKFEPEPENEFDVPYSSDVEAMILDMGLSPDEFDIYAHPEVQKYRLEETKRIIIRLEQATDACMQRAMEAKGAFAVLYSRSFKYFIMKPEVFLGRATEDAQVDIDLGREKNGSKISRRQAFMALGTNAFFQMKNLGKYPIFVNGKEVATKQSICLESDCLLEMRGLAFVFEMNHAEVTRYVDHMKTNIFLQQEVRYS